jgi:hypothetical protein
MIELMMTPRGPVEFVKSKRMRNVVWCVRLVTEQLREGEREWGVKRVRQLPQYVWKLITEWSSHPTPSAISARMLLLVIDHAASLNY